MSDVAQLAGVSIGTVSNVLNHPARVSGTTLERVQRAMTMLNYTPNVLARSLAAGNSPILGLVLTDLANSLFIDIARGAELGAEAASMALMMSNSDGRLDREASYIATFAQSRVAGVLLTLNDEQHYGELVGRTPPDTPIVVLNYAAPTTHFCSVSVDNEHGGYLATRHLLDIGRRRIAFVGGPEALRPVRDRERGFVRAMREAGVTPALELMPDGVNRADGYAAGVRLAELVSRAEVDAVFAATDLLAAGIAQAAESRGVTIPADLAIVGYDNNHAAWDSPIPISTVAQPGEEMGRRGVEMATAETRGGPHEHGATVLTPTLVVRRSTTG
ncbi:LacI family DNA-binding transcriptional regulator [Cellulomonas sp. JH27-2]|uniref:LacI family DNA-binding transcriptional regulator n=1 Tax=Cellulomonas sp. JH27-2 TaxID=2774139 RepID=UPI00177B7F9F|nr:LacI family DNA-binding transcriptional regulator [Cellulomonas sp. JH27-2]MBD8059194.1 LacI family DNA-binding transcriptional regulator [Cellulomonas sp. JH27-2]